VNLYDDFAVRQVIEREGLETGSDLAVDFVNTESLELHDEVFLFAAERMAIPGR
jgi:hypothetical protein